MTETEENRTEQKEDNVDKGEKGPERKTFCIKLAGSPNSCVIQVQGQRYRALVDTGAQISLVHRRAFEKLKGKHQLDKDIVHLQSVNGGQLEVDG